MLTPLSSFDMNSLAQTSFRSGKFKKKFLSESELKIEAKNLAPLIQNQYNQHQKLATHPAVFTSGIILLYLKSRYPYHWQGSLQKELSHFTAPILGPIEETLKTRSFKSTPLPVNRSLLAWAQGNYHLKLFTYIPSPREVLEEQSNFSRCVTVLLKEEEINRYILNERDHLSFIMHDLIHADHFFFDNQMSLGQVGFYRQMKKWIEQNHFNELLKSNEEYLDSFNYLISDMNAHCVHLWKGFKSITQKTSPILWENLLMTIGNNSISMVLEKLNTPFFNTLDDAITLSEWCEKIAQKNDKE